MARSKEAIIKTVRQVEARHRARGEHQARIYVPDPERFGPEALEEVKALAAARCAEIDADGNWRPRHRVVSFRPADPAALAGQAEASGVTVPALVDDIVTAWLADARPPPLRAEAAEASDARRRALLAQFVDLINRAPDAALDRVADRLAVLAAIVGPP